MTPTFRRLTDDEVMADLARDRQRPTHLPDGRALALTAADVCDDAFCVLLAGHDGDHDPPFDEPETDADRARHAAEREAMARLARLRDAPIAHVNVESAEQIGLFG